MPLLVASRRFMGVLVVGVLAALLLSNLVPDPSGRGVWRGGQKPPDASWFQLLHGRIQRVGFYFQDNFGFRASLPLVRAGLRDAVDSQDTNIVYFGRNGQMFWAGERAPAQSAGALVREEAVDRFVMLMAAMQRRLGPQGTQMVVAIPPNAQSVDLAELPKWQDALPPARTEYSIMLEGLKADGIPTVDLRKVLRESPEPRRYQPNDTHWTSMSSALAFNAIMVAAGHPDWQLDIASVIGPKAPTAIGDLARTIRRAPVLPDENHTLILKDSPPQTPHPALRLRHESPFFNGYSVRFAESGPRVLILGDSFTAGIWTRFFAHTPVAEAGWTHYSSSTLGSCDFDFADIERFDPDLLIIARTERMFPCFDDAWPANLPTPD